MNKVLTASAVLVCMLIPGAMLARESQRQLRLHEEQPVQQFQQGDDTLMEKTNNDVSQIKIGYVDLQKIMPLEPHRLVSGSHEWLEFYKGLEASLKKVDQELQNLEERYKKGREEFEQLRKSGLASQDTMQKQVQEVAQLEMQLQSQLQERGRFAQNEITRASNDLGPKIEAHCEDLCKEKGYALILRKEVVLASRDAQLDETDTVISRLNTAYDASQSQERVSEERKAADDTREKSEK